MAFDEQGQADNLERKEICGRAYRILTEEVGFPPEDIIFDPNGFALATGIEEHATYGIDFIEACAGSRRPARGAHLGRHLERVVLVPRQQPGPRGDPLGVPVPRHQGRPGHGHRQRRSARRYEAIDPELREACVRLRNLQYERDSRPLEEGCPCPACRRSRAYLRHLFMAGEMLGPILLSIHNLTYYQRLLAGARAAIESDQFAAFRAEKIRGWVQP